MSLESFNKLVKLTARAFYDDKTANGDQNQPKSGSRSDNRGIAVVVLDALTRRQWVREDDLAKDLKLNSKLLRRTLRFFEEEKLVTRDHRKEKTATADSLPGTEGEKKIKPHTHSYCCLDYAQIHDVVRYRLQRMRKKLKDGLDNKNAVQEYVCPKCGKKYNALDANRLISFEDGAFHCESCNSELVEESASQDIRDGDDNARRRHLLQKLEVELEPLTVILHRIKDLEAPDYGTLQAWELRASAVGFGSNSDPYANDSFRNGMSGTPMPFIGEPKIEVAFSGAEDTKIISESSPQKELPPWMIREGMNLKNEQHGTVMPESDMDGTSYMDDQKDAKKSISQDVDAKKLREEYIKAYYEALYQQQRAQEATNIKKDPSIDNFPTDADPSNSRKRKRDDDEENDVKWDETPAPVETFKVDFNAEAAEPSGDDDDIEWEEG